MEQLLAALAGAALGGVIALAAAEWSFRRSQGLARRLRLNEDVETLDGLISEVGLASAVAQRASPTPIPVDYLTAARRIRNRMDLEQSAAFLDYSQAVQRYKGRVERIVAYGIGKRAAGESPGSEKPERHAEEVLEVAPAAEERLVELRHRLHAGI